MNSFYSQYGQDKFLFANIFKNHTKGFFVDVGAHDGITINNTLYFEKNLNWTGINIEPLEHVYKKLIVNRPHSVNLNCAISTTTGMAPFISNTGYTEMLSGLVDTFHPRHLERLCMENTQTKSFSEIIYIPTKRLDDIFKEFDIKHVNYLSIDVEGAEYNVVCSIDFNTVFIDVIGFENNYEDESTRVREYLETKNYKVLCASHDIFMIHCNSVFAPN